MRVLLVEDNNQQAEFLKSIIRSEGMHAVVCSNINEAWMQLKSPNSNFSVLLLDLITKSPVSDSYRNPVAPSITEGEILIQKIRGDNLIRNIPIIAITAERSMKTKLSSLKFGADYYFNKPFNPDELVITIKNSVARFYGHSNSTITYGNITLKTLSREFFINDIHIPLTKKEYGFIESLALRPDQVVSKQVILTDLYGDQDKMIGDKVLDVFKFKVLDKMKKAEVPDANDYISVQWGLGYKLTCPPSAYVRVNNNLNQKSDNQNPNYNSLYNGTNTRTEKPKISINDSMASDVGESTSSIDVNFIKL